MFEAVYFLLAWLGGEGIAAIILMLLIGLVALGQQGKFISRQAAPALMTSLGIFGTFCGIFIALYEFDLANENGFQEFLDGMKTAFVTSLFGIAFAIVSRAFWSRPGSGEKSRNPEQREIIEHLESIKQAIAGDGDSSMVTQMRAMRDENQAGFKKLDGLSEAIRDALVKNIQQLMEQIRTEIGAELRTLVGEIREVMVEQLGKTFMELKDAVVALNEWQTHHREQVEHLTNAFNLAARQIVVIAAKCEKIPETMEKLQRIVESAHGDVEKLNHQLKAFADMHEQAKNAFPVIKRNLDKIVEDLQKSAEGFKGLEETISSAFVNAEEEVRRVTKQHSDNVQKMVAEMSKTLRNAQQNSSEQVIKIVNDAVSKFDSEMNREIDEVTKRWGENLVAVAKEAAEMIQQAKKREES